MARLFYRLIWRDIYNKRMYSVLPSYLTRHYRPLARQFYMLTNIKIKSSWHSVCYRLDGEIIFTVCYGETYIITECTVFHRHIDETLSPSGETILHKNKNKNIFMAQCMLPWLPPKWRDYFTV